jgi:serine/threonine protein kinase
LVGPSNIENTAVEEEMCKRRIQVDVFKAYLAKAGVSPATIPDIVRMNKTVEVVFQRLYTQAVQCVSPAGALSIYNMAETFATSSTKARYREKDIVLEEPLSLGHAHSHKAFLLRVFVDGVPKVFKYPQSDDNEYFVKSVQKDITFCNLMRERHDNSSMPGIVEYLPMEYITSEGVSVSGSLSNIYTCSLADIMSKFSDHRVYLILQRVLDTISRIHAKGYCINDIKLNNLYMDMHGNVDIADFGGFCEMGDVISEYTSNVLPVEYGRRGVAWPDVDHMCLVSCALSLMGLGWEGKPTVAKYRHVVETRVPDGELRNLLLPLFST